MRWPPPRLARSLRYVSGDIGISTPGFTCLIGPAALGITSKSKMSVGSHRVAQAFGMSTTPEMWPWHGVRRRAGGADDRDQVAITL
jgi:hypothetical protein